jgi:hypothetical protein
MQLARMKYRRGQTEETARHLSDLPRKYVLCVGDVRLSYVWQAAQPRVGVPSAWIAVLSTVRELVSATDSL